MQTTIVCARARCPSIYRPQVILRGLSARNVPGKVVEIRRRPDRGSRSVTVNTTLNPSGTIGTAVSGSAAQDAKMNLFKAGAAMFLVACFTGLAISIVPWAHRAHAIGAHLNAASFSPVLIGFGVLVGEIGRKFNESELSLLVRSAIWGTSFAVISKLLMGLMGTSSPFMMPAASEGAVEAAWVSGLGVARYVPVAMLLMGGVMAIVAGSLLVKGIFSE